MIPYHVETSSPIDLYQLGDGRFQVTKRGNAGDFISGFKYLLVRSKIADVLKTMDIDRVSFKPAVIWDRKTDEEDHSFTQMVVNHHFDSENLNDINTEGSQFLILDNRYLFVSPELKGRLEPMNLGLIFSRGFGDFG